MATGLPAPLMVPSLFRRRAWGLAARLAIPAFLCAVEGRGQPAPPAFSVAALPTGGAPTVETNDNRRPAGRLAAGVLTVALEARVGVWRPELGDGPALAVAAFGEVGGAPSTPGPLLRVPAGTEVQVTLHNRLPTAITVRGLDATRGAGGAGTTVAPGATHAFRFRADAPGVSYYLAQIGPGRPLGRAHDDSQLHGAIVVDPPATAGAPPIADRIFVLSSWFTRDTTTVSGLGPGATAAINGRSWPHTERLAMAQGDTARWRVVNASTLTHPMHLHGAYFRVDARGDGARDTLYAPPRRRLVVTETLAPGETMALAWTPVHPGNWVFHCHLASHIAPRAAFEADRRMPATSAASSAAPPPVKVTHAAHRPAGARGVAPGAHAHMAGLVLGITVAPRGRVERPGRATRAIRLLMRSRARIYGEYVGYGYVLGGSPAERAPDSLPVPGPLLELVRGERVAITLVNRTHEPAAVHWHGIELESYADGVAGWSGADGRVLPMIAPGDSLTVRFTPPRAGTFMYHSHANEMQQISSGLYGAIVVREPGTARDTLTDHVLVFGDDGPLVDFFGPPPATLVNGRVRPPPLPLLAGRTHRLRLVNIRTEALTALTLAGADGAPVRWRVVAKDGATLPAAQVHDAPATLRFAPGEIYDVEVVARAGEPLALRWESIPGGARTAGTLALPVR